MKTNFITGREAAGMIVTGGFVGIGVPEEIHKKIEQRFLATGEPNNLGLIYSAWQGDGKDKGLNHLGMRVWLLRLLVGIGD